MSVDVLAIAKRWAHLLDHDAFADLPAMMHARCTYVLPNETIIGPDGIVASYRAASEWAHATFDTIEWYSELAIEPDGRVRITFIDITRHKGVDHTYRCQQIITIGDDGLICHIEHIDLPEERAALDAFFDRVGVTR